MPDSHAVFLFLAFSVWWNDIAWLNCLFLVILPLWGLFIFWKFSKIAATLQARYDSNRSTVILLVICFLYRQFIAFCLWMGIADFHAFSWFAYIFGAFIVEEICIRMIFAPNDWGEQPPPYTVYRQVHNLW